MYSCISVSKRFGPACALGYTEVKTTWGAAVYDKLSISGERANIAPHDWLYVNVEWENADGTSDSNMLGQMTSEEYDTYIESLREQGWLQAGTDRDGQTVVVTFRRRAAGKN